MSLLAPCCFTEGAAEGGEACPEPLYEAWQGGLWWVLAWLEDVLWLNVFVTDACPSFTCLSPMRMSQRTELASLSPEGDSGEAEEGCTLCTPTHPNRRY